MNPLFIPTNQMSADIRTSSAGGGDEHPLKVRKPYTITKQRERWAEEEHKKFLEALQLYGRSWRSIEEHIGTKTAVQIRSHAQKFFSKVVRESGTDSNVKSIEIPPPRPKRKPAHPYPRKLGNSWGNGGLSIGKLERSLSPMKSGFEQENGSPTSVLSGIGSDTLGSLLSNITSTCASPVTSAAGSNEQEASPVEEQVPYIKLFGKTVLVTDSNKASSPPSVENTTQDPNPIPTLVFAGSQDANANVDLGAPSQNFVHWSGGVFPMFHPLPSSNFGDITNPRIIPLPLWGVCGNLASFHFNHLQEEGSRPAMSQSYAEPSSEKEQRNGCSWTDSNNASADEGGNVVCSLRRSPRSRSDASVRGFVPYRRCLVEKESQQYSHGVADDGEGQSIGLCL